MFKTELDFENALIQSLSTGDVTPPSNDPCFISEEKKDYTTTIFKSKLWKYEKNIHTTEELWQNFKNILEKRNFSSLKRPLTENEFDQVKSIITSLYNPYLAGQFLYGHNGVSQIEIDLDDGQHIFLNIFDQNQIGAGDTEYQIVTQIEREPKISGKQKRRFDTTLLINGLPIIQIEEKNDGHNVNEALRQMEQYIAENQYSDIFSTVQILVAMTPYDIKYMANTTSDKFNMDFAFRWQTKDCKTVRNWKQFTDYFLSIPMAHKMATNYMILDGTKNKQMIKVMRPYQVYATEAVITHLKRIDFNYGMHKVGYIWHTTGSGKTITSFKTAWLASRLPNVEKVVFLVDRIALTKQTINSYLAYDPEGADGLGNTTSIEDTNNTKELASKLKSKGNNIIVTSIQKLVKLAEQWKNKKYLATEKKIVFIVDEAHRSTSGESFESIQNTFKKAAWVGYTGTPMFDSVTIGNAPNTEDIFGPPLHQYTIREAIADRNVLGFKVDFETTIDEEKMKSEFLPKFYKQKYPEWTEERIQNKINHLTPDDMDDMIEPGVYDENEEHIRLVVEDIFKNWKNRSNDGKYNALFTTNVGGGKSSIPMALMYFKEFERVNKLRADEGKFTLKVGITFSLSTDNKSGQLEKNKGLHYAMKKHNALFGTNFDMSDVAGYTQDVTSRLAKTSLDKKYYDLVIVVDQLLTGFDAPELNTLYVDRTLKNANLIQAYSRTNRIANMQEKPWGRIVNYRWPAHNEKLMNESLSVYANKNSASKQLSITEDDSGNLVDYGVIAKNFMGQLNEVQDIVKQLKDFTNNFTELPPSEAKKEEMLSLLRNYSRGIAKLKQYDPQEINGEEIGFNYDNPDQLVKMLGITPEQEEFLTTALYNQLKEELAEIKNVPVAQIEFCMSHVKDIKINYDYLTELVEDLLNQVHDNHIEEAEKTKDKITKFTLTMDDRTYAKEINKVAEAIIKGNYPPPGSDFIYPAKLDSSSQIIQDAIKFNKENIIYKFRLKWGIVDITTDDEILTLIEKHQYGNRADLNDTGVLQNIQKEAATEYKTKALDDNVKKLNKIKYRNGLKNAMYEIADELVGCD